MDPIDQYLAFGNDEGNQNQFFFMDKFDDTRDLFIIEQIPEESELIVKEEVFEEELGSNSCGNLPKKTGKERKKRVGSHSCQSEEVRVLNKTKLIQKREHAKENARKRREAEMTERETTSLSIEEKIEESECFRNNAELNNPNTDEKTKKKIMQMIRNRISAQTSRDRKKQMLSNMEKELRELRSENCLLKNRVVQLEEQLQTSLKHPGLCPSCAETSTNSVSRSSPYILSEEDPMLGVSRASSRQSSPYTQNIMFLLFVVGCMLGLSGIFTPQGIEGGINGLLPSPSMSQGLVPVLGPTFQGAISFEILVSH